MERSFSRLALESNLALTKVRFYYRFKKFTSHVLCVICNDVMLWKGKEKNTVLPISALNGSTVWFAIFMKFYQYPFILCNKNLLQRLRYLTDIFIFMLKMWMYGRKLLRNNYLGNCWLGCDIMLKEFQTCSSVLISFYCSCVEANRRLFVENIMKQRWQFLLHQIWKAFQAFSKSYS